MVVCTTDCIYAFMILWLIWWDWQMETVYQSKESDAHYSTTKLYFFYLFC